MDIKKQVSKLENKQATRRCIVSSDSPLSLKGNITVILYNMIATEHDNQQYVYIPKQQYRTVGENTISKRYAFLARMLCTHIVKIIH